MEIDGKEKVDYLFKFIIIGDTGVGKSCILNQYLRGKCKYSKISNLSQTSRSNHDIFFSSQSKYEAHSWRRIWNEIRKGKPENDKGANMGHCGSRTLQIRD